MSLVVILDSGPLGIITNPKLSPTTVAILNWAITMRRAGHTFLVPAIADYEVRRELLRANKMKGIAELNTWKPEYLSLSDSALHLASKLWTNARTTGAPTADPRELDGDVLIAAQALDLGLPAVGYMVATTNPGHISQFVPCDLWTNIRP